MYKTILALQFINVLMFVYWLIIGSWFMALIAVASTLALGMGAQHEDGT